MIPTVVLHTPGGPRHKVTLDEARRSLEEQAVTIEPGDCVLLHTGWDRGWRRPGRYLTEFPYVSRDVVYWLMDQRIGIWGADTPRADSPDDLQGFFPDFFKTNILLLAPVVNSIRSALQPEATAVCAAAADRGRLRVAGARGPRHRRIGSASASVPDSRRISAGARSMAGRGGGASARCLPPTSTTPRIARERRASGRRPR